MSCWGGGGGGTKIQNIVKQEMTTISFYSLRIFKISPYIEFFIFFDRILAPPSERRPGADAPPLPPLATPLGGAHDIDSESTWYHPPPLPPHPLKSTVTMHCIINIYDATIQLTIHILLFFSGGQSMLMTICNQWCQLQP